MWGVFQQGLTQIAKIGSQTSQVIKSVASPKSNPVRSEDDEKYDPLAYQSAYLGRFELIAKNVQLYSDRVLARFAVLKELKELV
jgi:hypothetical protein